MAKSKLRLKRPAAGQPQAGATRAAPKPRARPPGTSDKGEKPSSTSAAGGTATGTRVETSANAGTPTEAGNGKTVTAVTAATQSTPGAQTQVPVEGPLGMMPSNASSVSTSQASAISQSAGENKAGVDEAGASAASMPPKRSEPVSTAMDVETPQGGAASISPKRSGPAPAAMDVDTPQGSQAPACEADATTEATLVRQTQVGTVAVATSEAAVVDVTSVGGTKSLVSQIADASSAAERQTTATITEAETTRYPHLEPHTKTNADGTDIDVGDSLQKPMDISKSTGHVPGDGRAPARGRGEEMGSGDNDEPINVD